MATTNRELAIAVLGALSADGVQFALLHGLERIERGDISDLDVVVDREPLSIVSLCRPRWADSGVFPVILWPYDIGGTLTVFLATADATDGVQLDLLHDPVGVGKYGVRTDELLRTADQDLALPVVSPEATLVYQWRKRRVKAQSDRLATLQQQASGLDRNALTATGLAITGQPDTASELLGEASQTKRSQLDSHPFLTTKRRLSRLVHPIGFWIHADHDDLAAALTDRFSRFLPVAESGAAPTGWRTMLWWLREVLPVRLRPGLFVSTGKHPQRPAPDFVIETGSVDEASRLVVNAMSRRLA